MMKFDVLEYGIYVNGNHIADFENRDLAIEYAREIVNADNSNVGVICNFTGEVAATFDLVTVVKTKVKEWVAE